MVMWINAINPFPDSGSPFFLSVTSESDGGYVDNNVSHDPYHELLY